MSEIRWLVVQYAGEDVNTIDPDAWYDLREDVEDEAEAARIIQNNITEWDKLPKMGEMWDKARPKYYRTIIRQTIEAQVGVIVTDEKGFLWRKTTSISSDVKQGKRCGR